MAGRDKKSRLSPHAQHHPYKNDRTEAEQLSDEVDFRMESLDRDSIQRNEEYQKAFKGIVAKTNGRGKYTAGDKLRATLAMVVTASAAKASRISGVPANTIRGWKSTASWWPIAVNYALAMKNEELDSDLGYIQDLANQAVIKSLKEGDEKLDRNGDIIKVKMSGKDAMVVSSIARDKQQVLRGLPTSISEKVSDSDRLEELAKTIIGAVNKSPKVIEGMVIRDKDEEDSK